ncbi:hypothetical protein [Thermus sp. FJN-A]
MLFSLGLLLAACGGQTGGGGGGGGGGGSTPSIAGVWEGTWTSTQLTDTSGTFCIKITQNGNQISGPLYRNGVYFGDASGTLNGNQITFGAAVAGSYEIQFTGTVSGNNANGNYTLNQGTNRVDAGTWSGSKTSKTDCPTSGTSQSEFSNNLSLHYQKLSQVIQQLRNDPAFQALFQSPGGPGMGGLSVQGLSPQGPLIFTPQGPLGSIHQGPLGFLRPLGLLPLNHPSGNELPRGGMDYTDPSNPQPYTPQSPYDLGLKWRSNSQVAELLVDWDKNGAQTVWAHDRGGGSHEVPRASQAKMTLGGDQVANADFSASWYNCQATSTPILEPTNLTFTGSLGQTAKLNWDFSYALTEGSTDSIAIGLTLSTTGANPAASVSYQLTLNGDLTRGADCFTERFNVQGGSFTFTSRAGENSFTFHINVTRIVFDQNGNPTRVDLNGYVDENNQRALTFLGYLDQDDLNGQDTCPGENLLLSFRDSSMTLEQWLRMNNYCPQN